MIRGYNPFDKDISELETVDLLKLRTVHEGWYVDYKAAPLKARAYAKAISAMANTYGGWIFIGVEEESRDHNVAGAFPGVLLDQTDVLLQSIRQGAAEHLNPQPFFEAKAINAPGTQSGEKVLCLYVPASPKAPIIHSDGRIYRRVNDASEPVAENNREVVEHLFSRVNELEDFYAEWFHRDPELSEGEDRTTYLRLISVADYWNEKNLWFEESTEEFAEILAAPYDGISFSMDYNNIFTQGEGFVCRSVNSDDARQFTGTFKLWRDLRSEFWLPLPSFSVDEYFHNNNQSDSLDELMLYLSQNGHPRSTVLDLTHAFGAVDGYFSLIRKFQKHVGYTGNTHVKFRLGNAWRRIPALALLPDELGWDRYGVPMILQDSIASPRNGSFDTFQEINLHQGSNNELNSFLLSTPVFVRILVSIGLGVGSNEWFSELVNKSIMASYDGANKKGFPDGING